MVKGEHFYYSSLGAVHDGCFYLSIRGPSLYDPFIRVGLNEKILKERARAAGALTEGVRSPEFPTAMEVYNFWKKYIAGLKRPTE